MMTPEELRMMRDILERVEKNAAHIRRLVPVIADLQAKATALAEMVRDLAEVVAKRR
jgi:hypothetical protein